MQTKSFYISVNQFNVNCENKAATDLLFISACADALLAAFLFNLLGFLFFFAMRLGSSLWCISRHINPLKNRKNPKT